MHWFPLTKEQVYGLAPDYSTQRAARTLAAATDWSCSGYNDHLLWAEFPDPKRPPTQTVFSTESGYGRCGCTSAKFPCRHLIALLLHYGAVPTTNTGESPPTWASEWPLATRAAAISNPGSEPQRLQTVTQGLLETERWLKDLLQQGLASAAQRPKQFWFDAANRLVDVYAEPLARDMRELAALPGQDNWPERLLARLGLLYLFIQGFKQFDQLSTGTQMDLQLALGWQPDQPTLDVTRHISDHWLVLGRRQETAERQWQQRLWLWGQESGRFALLADSLPVKANEARCLPTGLVVAATVAYYPSNWPLFAQVVDAMRPPLGDRDNEAANNLQQPDINCPHTIEQAISDYAQARTANPWLRTYPLLLPAVRVERQQTGWRLRDEAGSVLPLPPRFNLGWQLLSLSAGEPLSLFGDWNGVYLTPISLCWQGQWLDLHRWRAVV